MVLSSSLRMVFNNQIVFSIRFLSLLADQTITQTISHYYVRFSFILERQRVTTSGSKEKILAYWHAEATKIVHKRYET